MRLSVKIVLLVLAGGFFGLNAMAYMHARAMTHFSDEGTRTKSPERLSAVETARVIALGVNVPRPRNIKTPEDYGLPFVTHRFSTSHGPTLEAWYIPAATRNPLVLLFHGYATSKSSVLPSAAALHGFGYPTLVVDFYGSGGSSGTGTSLGYLEALDVAASHSFAQRLSPDRKIVLYGFSMGAAAILRAVAVEHIIPAAIILEAPFDDLLATAKSRFRSMGLPSTPFAQILLFWGGLQWDFNPFTHNPTDYARSVRCPTLILHGGADPRVTTREAHRLAKSLGAHGRLISYPGISHTLIVNAKPKAWLADVDRFMCGAGLCG